MAEAAYVDPTVDVDTISVQPDGSTVMRLRVEEHRMAEWTFLVGGKQWQLADRTLDSAEERVRRLAGGAIRVVLVDRREVCGCFDEWTCSECVRFGPLPEVTIVPAADLFDDEPETIAQWAYAVERAARASMDSRQVERTGRPVQGGMF